MWGFLEALFLPDLNDVDLGKRPSSTFFLSELKLVVRRCMCFTYIVAWFSLVAFGTSLGRGSLLMLR